MSFAFVGVLALSVMMSIAEMVSIRPMLFGEMSGFVTEFVDVELGVAVGIVYW
jgi:amino acid transporter